MINPYAPPESSERISDTSREAIKARVARPATALIIMASIQSVFLAIYLVSAVFIFQRSGFVTPDLTVFAINGLHFICLILIAVGAAKFGFLESYRFAHFSAVLACIPYLTPFMLLGIPFGVWSLRLLSDPLVRAAFPDTKTESKHTEG